MKRIFATLLVATTALAAPAAFAAGPNGPGKCDPNSPRSTCAAPQNSHDQARDKAPATQAKQQAPRARGHAPTEAQLKRLPKPPAGQQYRVIDNTLVRIDSDTAQVVATLGLLSALFQ